MSQSSMVFISVSEFKAKINAPEAKIKFLETKEGKLFASVNGLTFKAQATLTTDKAVRFMYSVEEGFDKGCFANVKELQTRFEL